MLRILFLVVLNLQMLYACLDKSQLYMLLAMPIILGLLGIWALVWLYRALKSWKNQFEKEDHERE